MHRITLVFIFTLIALTTGCAPRVFTPLPVDKSIFNSYHANGSVNLVNEQPLELVKWKGSIYDKINLKEITESVIGELERELISSGIKIDKNASKTLKVSIDTIFPAWAPPLMSGSIMKGKVELGDGQLIDLHKKNIAWDYNDAYNFQLNLMAAEIYNNETIRNYLNAKGTRLQEKNTSHHNKASPEERLLDLEKLLKKRLISQKEYNEKRSKILENL